MPDGPERERAQEHLFRGQSNDCYWHGLFGGIYLVHMRTATHAELIAAEDLADRALRGAAGGVTHDGAASITIQDLDLDGRPEALLSSDAQVVAVELDEGAGIGAWDVRATRVALGAVMRRRPEAYHEKLRAYERGT